MYYCTFLFCLIHDYILDFVIEFILNNSLIMYPHNFYDRLIMIKYTLIVSVLKVLYELVDLVLCNFLKTTEHILRKNNW